MTKAALAVFVCILVLLAGTATGRGAAVEAASVPYVSTTFPPSGLLLSAAKILSPVAVDRFGGKFQDPAKKGLYHVYFYLASTDYGASVGARGD